MNYQVHHFALRAAHDNDGGPWISLPQQSDQIRCFYFSAIPRPGNLLLGDINKESCGSLWNDFKDFVEYYGKHDKSPEDRGKWIGRMIYEHYAKRALQWELANSTFEKHSQLKELAVSVTCD